jgi:hypothetical protein
MNAGAFDDPIVVGIHAFRQFMVGDNVGGQVAPRS